MVFIKYFYILIFIFIINCSGNKASNYHGKKSLEAKFDKLEINVTNKNEIISLIGPPSIKSDFNINKWFYIERHKTNQSLFKLGAQKIIKNNVLIIELDERGLLANKKLLNINDMNDLNYIKNTTNKEFQNNNLIYNVFSSLREKINAPTRNKK